MSLKSSLVCQKTRSAFVWTNVLTTPFWAIFNMLPFILYKNLHATPFQITAIIILKPAASLFSVYWIAFIEKRQDRLVSNLIWARLLSHIPFFFFPFVDNPWFFIGSFGLYMALSRGAVPAWMEVLKLNVTGTLRERVFAFGSVINYMGAALLPFVLGGLMDSYINAWRWLFPLTALISVTAIIVKWHIPIALSTKEVSSKKKSWQQQLIRPWKNAWDLIWRRPDFARYQLGFMFGGAGLIIMQPTLPVFFMDELHLSYTELAVALTLCKGIGVAMTSSGWGTLLQRIDIYRFNGWVTFLAFLFPLFLIAAQWGIAWLYVAYILYGVMQGGSEMSWHLSGPLFAKEEDSSVYSSVNVLTVGLRGCFVPALGTLLGYLIHPTGVMVIGGGLCLLSTYAMWVYSKRTHLRVREEGIGQRPI